MLPYHLHHTRLPIMPIFTIDGNIGVGKSTILDYLHTHYHVAIDPEPVDKWQTYLDDMYRNKTGGFAFQTRVWLDRCWIQQRPNTSPLVMERSPFFQSGVFIPAMLDSGLVNQREYAMLLEMYAKSSAYWAPNGCIYLRSHPVKCLERVNKRGRSGEDNISLPYLFHIHKLHESTYMHAIATGIPVICIDVDGKTVPQIAGEVWSALTTLGFGAMR
jgi:deoxyadenosine/deoxycytidine kinase